MIAVAMHDVLDAVAERHHHRHGQDEQRESHQHVDETADGSVEPSANVAAEAADQRSDDKRNADRRGGDGKIEAGGIDDPGEHVAAELIGAGPMRGAGWLQRASHVRGDGIVGNERWADQRNEAQERGGRGRNTRHRVAAQDPADMPEQGRAHSTETLGSAIP